MKPRDTDWEGVRLHVVSGKGGTGKTTVAGALALALAADGRRTLLTEVEGRQGIAQLFDIPPLPYEERRITAAPGGGDVYALPIDPEQALLEYLDMFYKLGRAGKALRRLGAIDFATTIAPGLRDVLLTGKACEAVRRRDATGRHVYDAVVVDAPPTGRITRFLNVTAEVAGIARVGPIRTQAETVMRVIRSPETAVHLVTVLEEMPVQETVDGITAMGGARLPVGGIVVNTVRPPLLRRADLTAALRGRLTRRSVATSLAAAGLDPSDDVVAGLLAEAREQAGRVRLQEESRATLAGLGVPTYELPELAEGVEIGGLYGLAEALREQGAA